MNESGTSRQAKPKPIEVLVVNQTGQRATSNNHKPQHDRVGLRDPGYSHFFVVPPPEAGSARQLIHGEWHVGAQFGGLFHGAGPSWTPDSRKILVDSYDDPDRDLSHRRSHIYAVDAASGEKTWLTEEAG